jgi:hypothetical protein
MPDSLDLDMAPETKMFRALVRVLTEDETLARVVRTWQVADGEGDEKPIAETVLPAIKLVPDPATIKLVGPEDYDEGLSVLIDFVVAGTNADDRLNLWSAIRAALQPQKAIDFGDNSDGTATTATTVVEYLRQNSAHTAMIVQPGKLLNPSQPGQPMTSQYCRAQVYMGTFTP